MAKGFSSINLTMCSTIIMALTSCNVQEPESPSNALAGSVTANGLTYEIISGNDLRNTIAEHKLVRIPKIHDLAYRQFYKNRQAIRDCNGTCYGVWMIDKNRLCEQYDRETEMQCVFILRREQEYYESYSLDRLSEYITRLEITPINYHNGR